jgi:beta-glucosidase/6-phospho-beta-glucosidase/beta-galactosidase
MAVRSLHRSKFGLYHVDYKDPDRKRTPKQSAFFMGRITRTRRIPPIYKIAKRKLDKLEGL